jgi:hypothetical protein
MSSRRRLDPPLREAGKFRHRGRILAKVLWTGAESVLDVGF